MGAGNRISMLCLGEAIGHGLYDRILQRTETAQTQRWIAAECGREGLLENSKDGGLKHLTTTVAGASNQHGMKFCLMLVCQDEMRPVTTFSVGTIRIKSSNARGASLLSSGKLT